MASPGLCVWWHPLYCQDAGHPLPIPGCPAPVGCESPAPAAICVMLPRGPLLFAVQVVCDRVNICVCESGGSLITFVAPRCSVRPLPTSLCCSAAVVSPRVCGLVLWRNWPSLGLLAGRGDRARPRGLQLQGDFSAALPCVSTRFVKATAPCASALSLLPCACAPWQDLFSQADCQGPAQAMRFCSKIISSGPSSSSCGSR